jgi:hypothetical protein
MLPIRALIAVAMIVVGATIIVRMMPYPIAQTYTGLVLGIAMIALGLFRLRQIAAVKHRR